METLTVKVSESLLNDLEPYRDNLDGVLKAGLRPALDPETIDEELAAAL